MTAKVVHLNGEPLPTKDEDVARMHELLDKMKEVVSSGQARVIIAAVLTSTGRHGVYTGVGDSGWCEFLGLAEALKGDIWKEIQ